MRKALEFKRLTESGNIGKNNVDVKKIYLKHSDFAIIPKSKRDDRFKPSDIKFWLEHSDGDFLGNNPIRIATELKISPVDASKLLKKKLEDLKGFHEEIIKVIDSKLERIETYYSDELMKCESMREDYLKGTNTPAFQDHIITCQGCYNWFIKRVQNGDFHTQTLVEEIKKERQKQKLLRERKEWKEKKEEETKK
jgi:hypothetical protein